MSRDPLVTFCMARGLALDRETYIAGAYPQGKPDPWTAEHEAELPAIFREPRKWALIKSSGSGSGGGSNPSWRSRGNCEGSKRPAPFMRRNGEPYLEIHHIRSLADGGADHPQNVAAVCPNCHSHVTHGKDADDYNAVIAQNVKAVEAQLQSEAK